MAEGFDWNNNSFFEEEDSKRISAIIYFDMGDYENRKRIKNPNADFVVEDIILERL
ncbi:MAG: hypothetical protein ACE5IC_06480 [Candidatus Brocadiales bacterium]